jgi:hypothetical protein
LFTRFLINARATVHNVADSDLNAEIIRLRWRNVFGQEVVELDTAYPRKLDNVS